MSDNFDFDLDAKVKVITDDQILDSLMSYLRDHGNKPFTTTTYDGWSKKVCTSRTISKRFCGWRNALRKIGIEKGVRANEYTGCCQTPNATLRLPINPGNFDSDDSIRSEILDTICITTPKIPHFPVGSSVAFDS